MSGLDSISGPAFGNPTALFCRTAQRSALTGNLNNGATIRIDTGTRKGGSTFSVAGTLTNSGFLEIGTSLLCSATNVTLEVSPTPAKPN